MCVSMLLCDGVLFFISHSLKSRAISGNNTFIPIRVSRASAGLYCLLFLWLEIERLIHLNNLMGALSYLIYLFS